MSKDYVLEGFTPENFISRLDEVLELYNEYGVVIFPRFFEQDANYNRYLDELASVFDDILRRHANADTKGLELGEKLLLLSEVKPELGKIIADLGTQHNKFFGFNKIKYAEFIDRFLSAIWGADSIIATPQAGDTLHLFPPGKNFHRYNLPPHQDYHYLLQSPQQVTAYFGISEYKDNVGGLRIWEKSHKLGVLSSDKNEFGAYEVYNWEEVLKNCAVHDFHWSRGDFGLFDSLLAHSSIPNNTQNSTRIVQIFRYSNLNDDVARGYDYYSTTYDRRGRVFTEEHKDLYVETNRKPD